MKIGL
jgi:ubiquitin carboxyl-terminal hydrolase 14